MSDRPKLLDLFCGAGGAAVGYYRAGFDVFGVDIKPQKHFPFEFHRADALEYMREHGKEFDAIHVSPPCQKYSRMSNCRIGLSKTYPDLIEMVRNTLPLPGGSPWIIENVAGAPLRNPIILCGSMFGLKTYRHRFFESNVPLAPPIHPPHVTPTSKAGHWNPGTLVSVCGNCAPIALSREAMGIGWMNRDELSEAIPPAYTEFLGRQLIRLIERQDVNAPGTPGKEKK